MEEEDIQKAKEHIQKHYRYYAQYFLRRNINYAMTSAVKIFERKLLNINKFVYYIYHSHVNITGNSNLYFSLTKQNRSDVDYYHIVIIKIIMHLNAIFNELNKIKKRCSVNPRIR